MFSIKLLKKKDVAYLEMKFFGNSAFFKVMAVLARCELVGMYREQFMI
jgi:hypothetical protein